MCIRDSLRAGEGAGVTGIILDRGSADIYSPKVIRSTMGSIYRVPFIYTDDLHQTIGEVKKQGIRLYAAHLKGKHNYEEENYTGDVYKRQAFDGGMFLFFSQIFHTL